MLMSTKSCRCSDAWKDIDDKPHTDKRACINGRNALPSNEMKCGSKGADVPASDNRNWCSWLMRLSVAWRAACSEQCFFLENEIEKITSQLVSEVQMRSTIYVERNNLIHRQESMTAADWIDARGKALKQECILPVRTKLAHTSNSEASTSYGVCTEWLRLVFKLTCTKRLLLLLFVFNRLKQKRNRFEFNRKTIKMLINFSGDRNARQYKRIECFNKLMSYFSLDFFFLSDLQRRYSSVSGQRKKTLTKISWVPQYKTIFSLSLDRSLFLSIWNEPTDQQGSQST